MTDLDVGMFGDRGATISILDDAGDLASIVSTDGWIFQPRLSPDGTRLAYVDTGSILIVDLETGEIVPVRDGEAVEWLDDDRLIVGPDGRGSSMLLLRRELRAEPCVCQRFGPPDAPTVAA